ncbi:MAG TPA: metal ABC transporter permease [Actinomycetota bacterium]|nr:metal ABC transporter permease [Actinomycetota bacterium]
MDEFLRPFEFEFFRNGLMVATIASALCGMIGVYIVLRSMSYIGHGLSHAIFGGFAASSLMSINLFVGAGLWGLGSALLINRVTRRRSIGSDAAIGVITTASFALGLALIQLFGSPGQNPDAVLFGNVLGVSVVDVWVVVGVTIFATAVVFTQYRPLLFSTFDPEVAGASGVRTGRIDALLMLVLALSILATMNVMGVTLIAAGIVIPAVVARLLTHSFARMLPLATAIGAFSGFVGMMASYHLNVASGPAIVLTGGLLFSMAYLATAKSRVGGRPEKHLAHI